MQVRDLKQLPACSKASQVSTITFSLEIHDFLVLFFLLLSCTVEIAPSIHSTSPPPSGLISPCASPSPPHGLCFDFPFCMSKPLSPLRLLYVCTLHKHFFYLISVSCYVRSFYDSVSLVLL